MRSSQFSRHRIDRELCVGRQQAACGQQCMVVRGHILPRMPKPPLEKRVASFETVRKVQSIEQATGDRPEIRRSTWRSSNNRGRTAEHGAYSPWAQAQSRDHQTLAQIGPTHARIGSRDVRHIRVIQHDVAAAVGDDRCKGAELAVPYDTHPIARHDVAQVGRGRELAIKACARLIVAEEALDSARSGTDGFASFTAADCNSCLTDPRCPGNRNRPKRYGVAACDL